MRKSFRKRYKSREQFRDMLAFRKFKKHFEEIACRFMEVLKSQWRIY